MAVWSASTKAKIIYFEQKINECAPMKWPKPKYDSVEEAVTLDEAISDLPPLKGGWDEKWDEKYSYEGPKTIIRN